MIQQQRAGVYRDSLRPSKEVGSILRPLVRVTNGERDALRLLLHDSAVRSIPSRVRAASMPTPIALLIHPSDDPTRPGQAEVTLITKPNLHEHHAWLEISTIFWASSPAPIYRYASRCTRAARRYHTHTSDTVVLCYH